MTTSRADSHDLDKLERWCGDLCAEETGRFHAHAIFLVSADDAVAHAVFRDYRFSFEAHGAAFRHLVIFGQHGISSTARKLLAEFGLPPGATPTLVLYPESSASNAYALPLPGGDGNDNNRLWSEVLSRIESAAEADEDSLNPEDLETLTGLTKRQVACGSLTELAKGALESLSPRS
ncbi:MAG: hypothetical protein J4F46_03910 [Dehalococcoidia bacterium]|nr:hypothetical protein [Dehalococcoidia bacterium]